MERDTTQDLNLARLAVERGHVTWRQLTQLVTPGRDQDAGLDSLLASSGVIPLSLLERISAEAQTLSEGGEEEEAGARGKELPELAAGARFLLPGGVELEIERTLGRGGMGVVYLVRDPRLDRQAALKLHRCESDARRRARFRREAVITAQLDHPQIPPVYEAGEADTGEDYLLLRYVRGKSLAELIERETRRRGRASFAAHEPSRELLRALVSVARAVAYANARGIVHRDLKPENVMIGDFGEVLVLDWGLARDLRAGEPEREESARLLVGAPFDRRLTHERAVLGTLPYMSPEQARREPVDARSDVFSLGAVLCEVLCGAPPFGLSGSLWTVLARVCEAQVRLPSERGAEVPLELEAITARALAADPAARYATASALADDLEAFLEGRPVAAYRYRLRDRVRRALYSNPSFGTVLGLSLLGMLAVGLVFRQAWQGEIAAAREQAQTAWRQLQSGPRADGSERIARATEALRAARRWHRRAGSREAAAARFQAACALGEIALAAEQWALARQAYEEAEGAGAGPDAAVARDALARVEAAARAEEERRYALVVDLLERVAQGRLTWEGDLPESLRAAIGLARGERARLHLVERLEEVTVRLRVARRAAFGAEQDPALAAALGELERVGLSGELSAPARAAFAAGCARLSAPGQTWLTIVAARQAQDVPASVLAMAHVAARALGTLAPREEVVPALARHLEAEASPRRARAAGVALCQQREERVALAALARFGEGSIYADAVRAMTKR
ncbi:MAG: protein kinase [Planctomycetota bacterium]